MKTILNISLILIIIAINSFDTSVYSQNYSKKMDKAFSKKQYDDVVTIIETIYIPQKDTNVVLDMCTAFNEIEESITIFTSR